VFARFRAETGTGAPIARRELLLELVGRLDRIDEHLSKKAREEAVDGV
jgi:hypothetical protein